MTQEEKQLKEYRVYYINIRKLRGYSDMIQVFALNKEDAKDKLLNFLKPIKDIKNEDIIITKVEEE